MARCFGVSSDAANVVVTLGGAWVAIGLARSLAPVVLVLFGASLVFGAREADSSRRGVGHGEVGCPASAGVEVDAGSHSAARLGSVAETGVGGNGGIEHVGDRGADARDASWLIMMDRRWPWGEGVTYGAGGELYWRIMMDCMEWLDQARGTPSCL